MKQSSDEYEHHLIEMFRKYCGSSLGFDCHTTKLKKSESPDFVLCNDNHSMGIEITRAVDQNLQKANQIRNKEYEDVAYCPSLFENKNMKSQEIKEWMRKSSTKIIGTPYVRDGLEDKEFYNIIQAIEKKIKKFDFYKNFDTNILLVHAKDRVTLNHDFVISKLKEYVSANEIKFDYIFLKLGDLFHSFSNSGDKYYACTIQA